MPSAPATFCNVPSVPLSGDLEADVVVLGAPHGTPYKPGTASHAAGGPAAIRGALGWYSVGREQYDFDLGRPLMGAARVVDCGDVSASLSDGAGNRAAIRSTVETTLRAGALPLLLGGDDSTPIPAIEAFGLRPRPVTIVQIDAHIDWRDEVEGERFGFSSTMRRASEMAHVGGIVQVGARGPGSARASDVADARDWGVKFVTARQLHADGTERVLAQVPDGAEVFLSIDVDGLDPGLVPGVILPAFGGLGYQQMLDIIHGIAAKATLVGAAFVEYVPEKDPQGTGAQAISRLAANVIGGAFQEEPAVP